MQYYHYQCFGKGWKDPRNLIETCFISLRISFAKSDSLFGKYSFLIASQGFQLKLRCYAQIQVPP